jgi:hypothetical protein
MTADGSLEAMSLNFGAHKVLLHGRAANCNPIEPSYRSRAQ